ncbi:MAG: ribonuclease HII, partial [Candidatus Coatesbacteria bacterium]
MTDEAARLFGPSSPENTLRSRTYERVFWEEGCAYVAGVDEAGRGALAGPVVAAAVVLPPHFDGAGLDDSKRLPPARRAECDEAIRQGAVSWAVGVASARYVDRVNILQAALAAMKKACERLAPPPDVLLVDGNRPVPVVLRQRTVVGGDGRCLCIAAASILAKVHRDHLMALLDRKYPGYGFAAHKGYGTAEH